MVHSMQPPVKAGSEYPRAKYHWIKEIALVQNADEEAALGGGWADTSSAFAAYRGPRQARTAQQNPIRWVDAWQVPGMTSGLRKSIKLELLRADAEFWRSTDTPSAHLLTMRQAFDGIALVLFVGGVLTESLLGNEIPELVWDSAIAAGWWRCASETAQNIFPERVGHYWAWRDEGTDWQRLFHDEAAVWLVRLPAAGAKAVASDLGARLDAASESEMISHQEQAGKIGIGRSTYFEAKAGRGGKKGRRRAEEYLRSLQPAKPKPD